MKRVLLAEDHDDNRDMLMRRLVRAGYQVRSVANGRDAVQMTQSWRPDLILMDVSMPEMSGLEATALLRAQNCTIPIIALTAHAMAESRRICLEAGCNSFQTKPVSFPGLLEAMDALLRAPVQEPKA
jgi:two-component system, cell cycle response regulator DivK